MTEDDAAVEAVARAISLHNGYPDPDKEVGENWPAWRDFTRSARAAIEAYRKHLEANGFVIVERPNHRSMLDGYRR